MQEDPLVGSVVNQAERFSHGVRLGCKRGKPRFKIEDGDGGHVGGAFWGRKVKHLDSALLRLVPVPSKHVRANSDQGNHCFVYHLPTHPGSCKTHEFSSVTHTSSRAALYQ